MNARGLPWAGEIPVLGALFKSDLFQRDQSELVIVVTPYIVRPVGSPDQLRVPTDGFVPAGDVDRVLLMRQRALGTGPQVVAPSPAALASAARPAAARACRRRLHAALRRGTTHMRTIPARPCGRSAGLALLFGVAGCAGLNDPFERQGTWRPEHINDANLGRDGGRPAPARAGRRRPESPGELSAAAVRRLLTDHVKPLPSTDVGPIGTSGRSGGVRAAAGVT